MNTLDIVILICLIPFLISGFLKGFIAQLAAIVSVIVGAWLSFRFTGIICRWAGQYVEMPDNLAYVVIFTLIMVVVILLFALIGRLLKKVIKIAMLGWFDHLLGLIFSLIVALLVMGVIVILFNTLNTTFGFVPEEKLSASVIYTGIKDFAYKAFPYFKSLISN